MMTKIENLTKDLNEEDELKKLYEKLIFIFKDIKDLLNNLKNI
jgi:hypothetical protein